MKRFAPLAVKLLAVLVLVVLLWLSVRLLFYARAVAVMGPIPY